MSHEYHRLEAFSDGVIAIIITIMVLELKVPHDTTVGGLLEMWPVFFSYALSFITVAIYWMNHHHLINLVRRVDPGVMWTNMGFLFVLSLLPFATAYLGENHGSRIAVGRLWPGYHGLRHRLLLSPPRRRVPDPGRSPAAGTAPLHAPKKPPGRRYPFGGCVVGFRIHLAVTGDFVLPAAMYFIPDRQVEKLMGEAE